MAQPINPQGAVFYGKDGQPVDVESRFKIAEERTDDINRRMANPEVEIGHAANAEGYYSVAIGGYAGARGSTAVAIGSTAVATGDGAVAIGDHAEVDSHGSTALGADTRAFSFFATALGNAALANGGNSTALGSRAGAIQNNQVQLGNESITLLNCSAPLTVTSDERDKTDIAEIDKSLEFISKLRPVTFVRNVREKYAAKNDYTPEERKELNIHGVLPYDAEEHAKGTLKGSRRVGGLLAQEVQEVMQDIYGTDNYANVVYDDTYDITGDNKPESRLSLSYETLVPFLIGAIQELRAITDEQQKQIAELTERIKGAEVL